MVVPCVFPRCPMDCIPVVGIESPRQLGISPLKLEIPFTANAFPVASQWECYIYIHEIPIKNQPFIYG